MDLVRNEDINISNTVDESKKEQRKKYLQRNFKFISLYPAIVLKYDCNVGQLVNINIKPINLDSDQISIPTTKYLKIYHFE